MINSSRLTGFGNLEIDARHELLIQTTGLESSALNVLRPEQGLTLEQAAHMIENAVGVLDIPLEPELSPLLSPLACFFTVVY